MHARVRLPAAVLFVALLAACASAPADREPEAGGARGAARRAVNLPGRAEGLPFVDGVLAGDTLYVAGTLGLDPRTGQVPADVEAEARLVLDAIRAKLALAGMTMDDVVSVQVFCPDLALYDAFNAVYRTYFERGFPARSFIGSGPLLRGARFEVNAVAVRR